MYYQIIFCSGNTALAIVMSSESYTCLKESFKNTIVAEVNKLIKEKNSMPL